MAFSQGQMILLCALAVLLLAKPAHAFGAGNIGSTSKIEGQNWRHGDLEDTLLTIVAAKAMGGKKFTKLDVKRVSTLAMVPYILTSNPFRSTLATGFVITVRL
jgi:Heterokaryon incompatibility protein Het-C